MSTRLALVAAQGAIDGRRRGHRARMPDYDMGIVTANASGGFEFSQREFQKLWSQGPEHVSAYESFAWFYAVNTGQISIRHGMRGPGERAGRRAGRRPGRARPCPAARFATGTPLVVTRRGGRRVLTPGAGSPSWPAAE